MAATTGWSLRAAQSFTIDPDHLYARISGSAARRDGFITRYDYRCTHPTSPVPSTITSGNDCVLGTEGGKEYLAGRLAVRWQPTERITLDLVADVVEDDSGPGPTTLLYVGQAAPPGQANTGFQQFAGLFSKWRALWHAGRLGLRQLLALWTLRARSVQRQPLHQLRKLYRPGAARRQRAVAGAADRLDRQLGRLRPTSTSSSATI
jgi:hypothetical protein